MAKVLIVLLSGLWLCSAAAAQQQQRQPDMDTPLSATARALAELTVQFNRTLAELGATRAELEQAKAASGALAKAKQWYDEETTKAGWWSGKAGAPRPDH